MRQAGPLAAAGIVALRTMVTRLAEDHTSAKRLARGLAALDATLVDVDEVQTNIVKVQLPQHGDTAAQWSQALEHRGIRVSPCERYALRFVTHRHIGEREIDVALNAFESARTSARPR